MKKISPTHPNTAVDGILPRRSLPLLLLLVGLVGWLNGRRSASGEIELGEGGMQDAVRGSACGRVAV